VNRPAYAGPAAGGPPEVVVAPARPDIREVRELSGGYRAMPVFSTVSRLVATLGPDQPWVALPLRNIQAIMGGAGVHTVVIDPRAEPGAWRWGAGDLRVLERRG
jgi:hypothetical protein